MLFNNIKAFILAIGLLILSACSETIQEKNPVVESDAVLENEGPMEERKIILFFGNSLTAGYGVKTEESFPALIQTRIDSLGLNYEVVNAGVSGETTATGLNRLDWVLDNYDVDIFVLELGANDGLRGLPPEQTQANLLKIIERVRSREPTVQVVLAGMMVPPSMGPEYVAAYNPIFKDIAREKDIELIPFLLQGVGGIDSLNQNDGIHPNSAGNLILRENVWKILRPMVME